MKLTLTLFYLFCLYEVAIGQHPFFFSLEQPEIDLISDVVQVSDRLYFIQNRTFNLKDPYDFDSYSDLLITTEDGVLIEKFKLNDSQACYHRILKVFENEIYLVGQLQSDSCKNKLVISKFNIPTRSLVHLSSYDFCENEIQKIKIIQGLSQKTFIEEYHSVGNGLGQHIYSIDSAFNITLVMDSVPLFANLSIDFSRTGYLISHDKLKRFYDADFNFRKQLWFYENVDSENETHKPFGDHLILLQTLQPERDLPNAGFQFMIIDSLLRVKNKTIILPTYEFGGTIWAAYYGGVEFINENEIWASGDITPGHDINPSVYFIAKMDSNLNILCQHFLGYDTWSRTYGIRPLESGGAIVVGSKLREGQQLNEGLDVFAIRVGENCELPASVSTNGPQETLISISAYPNPGINNLTFTVNGFDPEKLSVDFIDAAGKVLFTITDLTNSIHVPELPAGQYFYRILQKERLLGVGAWVKQ